MLEKSLKEMTTEEKMERALELLEQEDAVKGQADLARHLYNKMKADEITCSVIGQFKRGKSALVNSLIGRDILPVGIVPITSAATKLSYGSDECEIVFENGTVEKIAEAELAKFVSEQENRDNKLGVRDVNIRLKSDFLKSGLLLVDTPGTGSFHKGNTEVAYDHMKESDQVVFLLSVDSPVNEIEMALLESTRAFAARFYFAVNKADLVSPEDLATYTAYCKEILSGLMDREIEIFPISAKTGEGVPALKEAILRDAKRDAADIMARSTEKKFRGVLSAALTQLDFHRKAMNYSYKEMDEHFEATKGKLSDIEQRAEAMEGRFATHLNEFKMELSDFVQEEFGIEYHMKIDEIRGQVKPMERDEFLAELRGMGEELRGTLDRILLYREENAYTVCHRINAVNRLVREIRRVRDSLAEAAAE